MERCGKNLKGVGMFGELWKAAECAERIGRVERGGQVSEGVERCGNLWNGPEWCGRVWKGMERCGKVWTGVAWCGQVWKGAERVWKVGIGVDRCFPHLPNLAHLSTPFPHPLPIFLSRTFRTRLAAFPPHHSRMHPLRTSPRLPPATEKKRKRNKNKRQEGAKKQ